MELGTYNKHLLELYCLGILLCLTGSKYLSRHYSDLTVTLVLFVLSEVFLQRCCSRTASVRIVKIGLRFIIILNRKQ